MTGSAVTARSNVNVALVKYWGKRDPVLNLPATGSISLTLDGLSVEARVSFGDGLVDELTIDGEPARGDERVRLARFLDIVRDEAGRTDVACVTTRSQVPRGAGLASSAAAFAALALAGSRAAGLQLDAPALSVLARRGSGSAARSIFGGFVEWHRGERADGSDSVAEPLLAAGDWELRVVVAITHSGPKAVSSREGMARAATSPLYPAWVAGAVERHAGLCREAVQRQRDAAGRGQIQPGVALAPVLHQRDVDLRACGRRFPHRHGGHGSIAFSWGMHPLTDYSRPIGQEGVQKMREGLWPLSRAGERRHLSGCFAYRGCLRCCQIGLRAKRQKGSTRAGRTPACGASPGGGAARSPGGGRARGAACGGTCGRRRPALAWQ